MRPSPFFVSFVMGIVEDIMRCFIAIEVPSEIKSAFVALQNDLRSAGADVAWTNPDNVHLTLKFLGEIDKKLVSKVEQVCLETISSMSPFKLGIDRIGLFPNERHPRVLWIGLGGELETLEKLQEQLDERLAGIGFEIEEKDFQPHLTVGRIRSNKNLREMLKRSDGYSLPSLSFVVQEIVLMKSDLLSSGACYSELAKARMK
jgi:RNA 2',3'-cyclic 3'-phosphodiesterase